MESNKSVHNTQKYDTKNEIENNKLIFIVSDPHKVFEYIIYQG